jgi:hypothetical protein
VSDVEGWKKALLTLAGDRFLLLVRNYVGEIRTPYNKQDLVRQLVAFLSERRTQERIASLIDDRDAAVITALLLLGSATLDSLATVFAARIGLLALGETLANLEERLLVYREVGETRTFAVNPVLEPFLAAEVADTGRLFGRVTLAREAREARAGGEGPLWVSDAALLALLAQLCSGSIPLKKGGGLRKRDLSALAAIFAVPPAGAVPAGVPTAGPPAEAASDALERPISALLRLLEAGGLLAEDGRPRVAAWRSFARRPRGERAAALLAPLLGPDVRPELGTHVVAGLLAALAGAGPEAAFDATAPAAVAAVLALKAAPRAALATGALVAGLRDLNVLAAAGDLLALHGALGREPSRPSAIVQPNFEITFPADIGLENGLEAALAAEARRVDAVAVFEITRASFQRYLDLGGSADRLVDSLQGLAAARAAGRPQGAGENRGGAALPQNVVFSVRTWEREYRRLALYEGIVLVADEDHQYLLDNSPALRRYMRTKVAPGVYLLAAADREAWMAALRRAGVEHVPETVAIRPEAAEDGPGAELPFEEPALTADLRVRIDPPRPARRGAADEGDDTRAPLHAELARMGLRDEEAAEIRDRIDRGLILFPAQLRPLATEKAEARGLDYLGKVRLIERAIERRALVEMLERTPTGAPQKTLCRPLRLEKSAGGLILAAESVPDAEPMRVSVSRLARVRLVMRSLLD